jgi:exonuclease III
VGDLSTPLSSIDRTSRQRSNKDILDLNNILDKINLIDIYRVFHTTTADYTFFAAAHSTFSKIDHILSHKVNFNKQKKN